MEVLSLMFYDVGGGACFGQEQGKIECYQPASSSTDLYITEYGKWIFGKGSDSMYNRHG